MLAVEKMQVAAAAIVLMHHHVPEALKGRWGQAPRQQQPPASSQPPAYSRATAESSSKHNESDSSDVAENPLIEGIDRGHVGSTA